MAKRKALIAVVSAKGWVVRGWDSVIARLKK